VDAPTTTTPRGWKKGMREGMGGIKPQMNGDEQKEWMEYWFSPIELKNPLARIYGDFEKFVGISFGSK
jgi:hypothetical protein